MPEMKSLAAMYFNGVVLKGDKASHVGGLQKLIEEQPTVLTHDRGCQHQGRYHCGHGPHSGHHRDR